MIYKKFMSPGKGCYSFTHFTNYTRYSQMNTSRFVKAVTSGLWLHSSVPLQMMDSNSSQHSPPRSVPVLNGDAAQIFDSSKSQAYNISKFKSTYPMFCAPSDVSIYRKLCDLHKKLRTLKKHKSANKEKIVALLNEEFKFFVQPLRKRKVSAPLFYCKPLNYYPSKFHLPAP